MNRKGLAVGLILLFIVSIVVPMTLGYNVRTSEHKTIDNFNRYLYPEYYDCYTASEKYSYKPLIYKTTSDYINFKTGEANVPGEFIQPLSISVDSPWPMYCHDTRHTGRSPYSTVDTWDEIWKFETWGTAWGGPAIDEDGTIYIGAYPLHAVYPNGTEKWTFNTDGYFTSVTPAIDENGTIYIGTRGAGDCYFYAINPNGTMKWRHPISETYSSPAIANDGSIIFTDTNNWIGC